MRDPSRLQLSDGRVIAYRRRKAQPALSAGARPGVVFLGGFRSDMEGSKALFLDDWARRGGRGFLRFDYTGHGASSGVFEEGCVGDWARDARDAIEALTEGPQILVGSSMGGWIALLLARQMPERIAALVGIAAAPDFTEELILPRLSEDQSAALEREGRIALPSDYGGEPQFLTRRMLEDGRAQRVLQTPLKAGFPVRLLQGMKDPDVPWESALRLVAHLDGSDVQATLIKHGDHRLSDPETLRLIARTIEALDNEADAVRDPDEAG